MTRIPPSSEQLTLLWQAPGLIERDALVARLMDQQIRPVLPERTVSRKLTADIVDLSLGGYSVFFDGFPVLVPETQLARSLLILKEFLLEFPDLPAPGAPAPSIREGSEVDPNPRLPQEGAHRSTNHVYRYLFCSVMSLTFPPLVFQALALYHLVQGIRKGQQFPPLKSYLAGLLAVFTGVVQVLALFLWLKP